MTVSAYAKVNFTLEVFGKRSDGYHALRSVVMPISLADTLEIEATEDGTISSDTGYDDDLCVKAAKVLRQYCTVRALADTRCDGRSAGARTVRCRGALIRVAKRIPAGGGLGGGSADAAAVLRALNELWGLKLSREELSEIAAQVGSDVPALVLGGAVLMEGRGERVEDLGLETGDLNLILVNPGVHSSTKDVYAATVERASCPFADSPTAKMVASLRSGDLVQIAAATMNDLQAPAMKLHPAISDALVSLRTAGATGVTMTGSGSCVFGFAPDARAAEKISAELNLRGCQSWPVQTLSHRNIET